MPGELILEMKGISKSFPGVKVFDNFDFDLRKGEIHCICGENGAGKSTLIKMLSGAYTPDKGEIYFDGKKVTLTPHSAMQIGIQTIYQEHTLFPLMNVVENLFAGKEITHGIVINRPRMVAKTREVLQIPAFQHLAVRHRGQPRQRRTEDGGNRQGPDPGVQSHHSGRADSVFQPDRNRAPAGYRQETGAERYKHHLHLAPPRRSLQDRRPGHRHPRRTDRSTPTMPKT